MPSSISLIHHATAISALILLLSTISSAAPTSNVRRRPFNRIYAFGDSFTDTGNSRSGEGPAGFGHLSSFPYGMTYFKHPTNRYSDGRLTIDFVAQSMNLPFLPPYLSLRTTNGSNGTATDTYGVNFAVSGATVIKHAFFVENNVTLDMTPQSIETELGWFEKYLETLGTNQKVSLFKDSLFWIGEIGVNDYAYTVWSTVSSDTIRELSISTYTRFLETLLNKGVRHMVVQGHPATGCLTLTMSLAAEDDRDSLGCVQSINNQSYTHNLALQYKLKQLRIKYPNTTIVYADYWNAYRTVIKNPSKYGISVKFKACCGIGEPYNFQVFETCGSATATAWDSSNTSGASTGGSSSRRRGGVINGIPKRCWCGEEILPLMSRSDNNPYRRYFRCVYAVRKKLENDNHVFKWIDEALINEIEKLEFKSARLEEELREMRKNEVFLGERVQMKVEKELFDKVEDVLVEAKGSMKKMMLSAFVGCVVLVCIMEFFLKSW